MPVTEIVDARLFSDPCPNLSPSQVRPDAPTTHYHGICISEALSHFGHLVMAVRVHNMYPKWGSKDGIGQTSSSFSHLLPLSGWLP